MKLLRSLSKGDANQSESVILKCNFALLQSFIDYPKSSGLRTVYLLWYPGIKLVRASWRLKKIGKFVDKFSRRSLDHKTDHFTL